MVYFISDNEGHMKIGVTNQDIELRLSELQCGNPYELSIVKTIRRKDLGISTDDYGIEKVLHEYFINYRIRGEWFFEKGIEPILNMDDMQLQEFLKGKIKDSERFYMSPYCNNDNEIGVLKTQIGVKDRQIQKLKNEVTNKKKKIKLLEEENEKIRNEIAHYKLIENDLRKECARIRKLREKMQRKEV